MYKLLLSAVSVAGLLASGSASAVVYQDGQTAALTSGFVAGTYRPSYIGTTSLPAEDGSALDGKRAYFQDTSLSTDNPATAAPFNLAVWSYDSTYNGVRVYNYDDAGLTAILAGSSTTSLDGKFASELMGLSVWGCNAVFGDQSLANDCKTQAEWTLLSDTISFSYDANGKPLYTFAGLAPTTIYRGGSAEYGLVNAYTQDYTFGSSYNFFGVRASTIAMQYDTAGDTSVDTLMAFNGRFAADAVPVPEPGTLGLLGLCLAAAAFVRRPSF